jgi:hypothetical protein
MNESQKAKLSFIAGNIEQSPTPHNLASAVASIATMLLEAPAAEPAPYMCGLAALGEGIRAYVEQPAAVDVGPAVIECAATQLVQPNADPQPAAAPTAETPPPVTEDDRQRMAASLRAFGDRLEAGEPGAVETVREVLEHGRDGLVEIILGY